MYHRLSRIIINDQYFEWLHTLPHSTRPHTHTLTLTHTHAHTQTQIHTHTHKQTHTIYTYKCVHTHTHTIYTYKHKHSHTHILSTDSFAVELRGYIRCVTTCRRYRVSL